MKRYCIWVLLFVSPLALGQEPAAEREPDVERTAGGDPVALQVIDPFAELRTGPGRGYPAFYAVEQGETIEVLTRRPGWYEIRSAGGETGWTSAGELSRTMQDTGAPADLPTVSHGDYLRQSWRVGMKSGRFLDGELNGAELFSATLGYKLYSWLAVELELGRFFGDEVRGEAYGLNAMIEPFSQWSLSPFISAGLGTMNLDSQPKLVPLEINSSDYENYSAGAHYYLGRNFVVQGSYRQYVVDAGPQTERMDSWVLSFSAFF